MAMPKTDFYTCKACHLDNGEGGHFEWQLLVDNPELAAKFLAAPEEEAVKLLSDEQKKLYGYNTTVMNDVHMSHAMEFPYPQSMANCVTCHEGKLDKILTDANFKVATCKSCHPVTGAKAAVAKEGDTPAYDTTKLALKTIMPEAHPRQDGSEHDGLHHLPRRRQARRRASRRSTRAMTRRSTPPTACSTRMPSP